MNLSKRKEFAMKMKFNRRSFLKTSLLAASTPLIPAFPAPAFSRDRNPSEKLNIACVGVNGMGANNLNNVKGENIIALCDVNDNVIAARKGEFPDAKTFFDFREMFDAVKDIDAAVISTPDHNHAVITLEAMKHGIHCYTEKPLAHDVAEIRAVQKMAREKNLFTQMGTIIHAGDNYRRVVEIVKSGMLGVIRDVHVWCNKGWGGYTRPTVSAPCPPELHWDLWIGPAPMIDYSPDYQPARWRGYWPFGTGTFGDMACHLMDLPFWALDLGYPLSVESTCPAEIDPFCCPLDVTAHYEFPHPDGGILNLTWYDGKAVPSIMEEKGLEKLGMGIIFVGDEGILEADYGTLRLYPADKFADGVRPEPTIPSSIGHHQEWFRAIR